MKVLFVFDEPQRNALATLFLNLRGGGFDVAGIFLGLWLFPLGLLVYRSRGSSGAKSMAALILLRSANRAIYHFKEVCNPISSNIGGCSR